MKNDREKKQKKIQQLFAKANECLRQAANIAEELGEIIEYDGGGVYHPNSIFSDDKLQEKALEKAKELGKTEYDYVTNSYRTVKKFDDLTDDEKEELVDDIVSDIRGDMREYADPGEWWQPSTC